MPIQFGTVYQMSWTPEAGANYWFTGQSNRALRKKALELDIAAGKPTTKLERALNWLSPHASVYRNAELLEGIEPARGEAAVPGDVFVLTQGDHEEIQRLESRKFQQLLIYDDDMLPGPSDVLKRERLMLPKAHTDDTAFQVFDKRLAEKKKAAEIATIDPQQFFRITSAK